MIIYIEIVLILIVLYYAAKVVYSRRKIRRNKKQHQKEIRLYQQHDTNRTEAMSELQLKKSINSNELKVILQNRQAIQSDYNQMIQEQKEKNVLKKLKTKT